MTKQTTALSRAKTLLVNVAVVLAALFCQPLAADIVIPKDATVGLVLSGGGARGLAHVGVIRVLEAQGIHPQIVTGTSMGSIIGALYASGKTADQIDEVARNMNWERALTDASPRRDQPYTFRQLESGMTTDVRMSITKQGIAFPKGAIQGQHLEQTLGNLFEANGKPLQFNEMPRRFAAIASDLENGQVVVMTSGDVASATRASMSIPGAIAPVSRDGKLLVDGGLANNMPINIARQMGADFIIAVDVSAPLKTRDELNSLFSIATQVTGFLVRLNTIEQNKNLNENDILIVPELDGYGSTSFEKAGPIIEAGTQAALKTFKLQEEDLRSAGIQIKKPDDEVPIIDFIRVNNTSAVGDDIVRAQIHHPVGQPFNRELIEKDLSRLYGLDYFSVVRYRVVEEGEQHGLEVSGIGRENGNSWLKLGLELADDFEGNSVVGITASVRAAGLNAYGGTAFSRVVLGTTPELELRYLQPLTSDLHYFIEPAIGYRADNLDIYAEDFQSEPLSQYQKRDYWAALSLGRLVWDGTGEVRVGVAREKGKLNFRGGFDLADQGYTLDDYHDGFYFYQLGRDTLDDLGFPTEGSRWTITGEHHHKSLQAQDNFTRAKADATFTFSWGANTLLFEGDAAISDSDSAAFVDIPFIGGFLELSGLPPRSRFGRHRALVRSVYYRRLTADSPLPIELPTYFGFSLERGNVWLQRDDIGWDSAIGAASIFLGARTPLGPAYLSYGRTDAGDSSVAIFLGQRFR